MKKCTQTSRCNRFGHYYSWQFRVLALPTGSMFPPFELLCPRRLGVQALGITYDIFGIL